MTVISCCFNKCGVIGHLIPAYFIVELGGYRVIKLVVEPPIGPAKAMARNNSQSRILPTLPTPILLSSVYPFVSGAGKEAHQRARATLKLDCLLHDQMTLPGSMALKNPFVRELVLSNLEFLEAGDLILDLRNECDSFVDLSRLRSDGVPSEVSKTAHILDRSCRNLIRYSASDTSSSFKQIMLNFVRELAAHSRKPGLIALLRSRIDSEELSNEMFNLDRACRLGEGTHWARLICKAARYYYCCIGAMVVKAEPQVPKALWDAACHFTTSKALASDSPDPVMLAGRSVLDYFAIDLKAVDRITPGQILKLKSESIVKQFREELAEVISKAESNSSTPIGSASLIGTTKELGEEIKSLINQRIASEQTRSRWERGATHILEEVAGAFIPALSTGKSVVKKLGVSLARVHGFERLEHTTTPLVDFQMRLRDRLVQTQF